MSTTNTSTDYIRVDELIITASNASFACISVVTSKATDTSAWRGHEAL